MIVNQGDIHSRKHRHRLIWDQQRLFTQTLLRKRAVQPLLYGIPRKPIHNILTGLRRGIAQREHVRGVAIMLAARAARDDPEKLDQGSRPNVAVIKHKGQWVQAPRRFVAKFSPYPPWRMLARRFFGSCTVASMLLASA